MRFLCYAGTSLCSTCLFPWPISHRVTVATLTEQKRPCTRSVCLAGCYLRLYVFYVFRARAIYFYITVEVHVFSCFLLLTIFGQQMQTAYTSNRFIVLYVAIPSKFILYTVIYINCCLERLLLFPDVSCVSLCVCVQIQQHLDRNNQRQSDSIELRQVFRTQQSEKVSQ